MVDCRLCKNHYTIYRSELNEEAEERLYVCIAKEVFIQKEYIANGPCDLYVDVDGDIPRNGDM